MIVLFKLHEWATELWDWVADITQRFWEDTKSGKPVAWIALLVTVAVGILQMTRQ